MAHPQPRHDTPELRLRCLTEFPPLDGTLPIKHLEGRDIERSEIVCSAASARGPSHEAHHVTVRRRAIHHGVLSAAGNLSRQAQRIDGRQP